MTRSVLLVGAAVAVAAAVAFAWYAPTVLVAAPLWVMALCVITGYRAHPDAEGTAAATRRGGVTIVKGGLAGSGDQRRAAG